MQVQHIHQQIDSLFRHESGKLVAVLTRIFGTENIETAEDVVQQTFMSALDTWQANGVPDKPAAWLYRVAKNKAIDVLRKNKHAIPYDFADPERALLSSEYSLVATMENLWKEELVKDDMLRMMFACCHPDISSENQITLILKTLCGFSTAEIAKSFLTSEDTVSKRLYRTKEFFRQKRIRPEIPSVKELKARTGAVLRSIYLLFNEGYNSTNSETVIRKELIDEAGVLTGLLAENHHTQLPEVFALKALICFHAARSDSRLTTEGEIILLPKQDRSRWNKELISAGNENMNRAAFGDELSSYHLEAAIAYEHCIASSFVNTNWRRIIELYELLCRLFPSPISELNKIVAILQYKGADAALQQVSLIRDNKKLETFYLYHSLMGEIYARLNHTAEALKFFETALELTQSAAERKILKEKIKPLLN